MKSILIKCNAKNLVCEIYPSYERNNLIKRAEGELGFSKRISDSEYANIYKEKCAYNSVCYSLLTEKEKELYMVMDCDKRYALVGYSQCAKLLMPIFTSDSLNEIERKRNAWINRVGETEKIEKSPDDMLWVGNDGDGKFILRIIELQNDVLECPNFGEELLDFTNKIIDWVKDFVSKYGAVGGYCFYDECILGISDKYLPYKTMVISADKLFIDNNGKLFVIDSNGGYHSISDMVIDDMVRLPEMLIKDLKIKRNKNSKENQNKN